MVTGEDLDTAESENFQMLEYLEGESEGGLYDVTEKLLETYNQREILRYILDALMEEPDEGFIIRDENVGIMFIYLKTVLDAMDR
jgi:hypothetical protein